MLQHRSACTYKFPARRILFQILGLVVSCQFLVLVWHAQTYELHIEIAERIIQSASPSNSTLIEAIWHRVKSEHIGSFRVRFAPNFERERGGGRPVLRIRVVGPQVKLLHSYRSNSSDVELISPYSLECAGRYFVEITPLFEQFYDDDIARGKILPQWPPYVDIQTIEVKTSLPTCQLSSQWRRKPFCNEHLMRLGGSWVVDDTDDGYGPVAWDSDRVQRYLARTKMYPDHRFMSAELYQRLLPGSIDRLWNATEIPFGLLEQVFPRLKYRYFHCQPHNGTSLAERCQSETKGKPICLLGDSQTRFLHNGFVEVMEPENTECSTIKNKEVCPTNLNLRYMQNCYGEITAEQTEDCGMVLVNFGQWPISWVEDKPYPASRYQSMVRQELSTFANVPNLTVYWINTNTMALNGRIIGHLDWRHDPAIELYNRIASQEANDLGIPVLDIYSISSVLYDLSVDRSHYKAPVLTALVHAVSTIVCKAGS